MESESIEQKDENVVSPSSAAIFLVYMVVFSVERVGPAL
jgi:hypothetical protein